MKNTHKHLIFGPNRIVPTASFFAPGLAAPISVESAPNLQNHGGKVIQSVAVVPIFWGASWSTGINAQLIPQLEGFFDFIVTSSIMDMLAEYSTSSTPIQHGRRLPSVHLPGSEPGNVTSTGRIVTDTQIQQALQTWIQNGTAPATSANTLYFIYLPPNVICDGAGGAQSCTQMCGYHDHIGSSVYYAVIPYVTCYGCVFPGNFLDTLTEVSSHEFCEAITDPTLSTWWDSNTGNEIGDICNRQTTRLGGYLIQTEWSNSQSSCAIAPVVPPFAAVYQQGDPGNGIGGYDLKSPADRVFAFDYVGSGKLDHLALYRPGTRPKQGLLR